VLNVCILSLASPITKLNFFHPPTYLTYVQSYLRQITDESFQLKRLVLARRNLIAQPAHIRRETYNIIDLQQGNKLLLPYLRLEC
jgi:hypothetical protein